MFHRDCDCAALEIIVGALTVPLLVLAGAFHSPELFGLGLTYETLSAGAGVLMLLVRGQAKSAAGPIPMTKPTAVAHAQLKKAA